MGRFILSLDQGTTSSLAILFTREGEINPLSPLSDPLNSAPKLLTQKQIPALNLF